MLSLLSKRDQLGVRPGRLFIGGRRLDWPDARFDQINHMPQPIVDRLHAAEEEIARLQTLDNGPVMTFAMKVAPALVRGCTVVVKPSELTNLAARNAQTTTQTWMGLCSTFLSGQVCATPSRAIVHRSIMGEFLHHAQEQLGKVRLGDPFDPATTSAPIKRSGMGREGGWSTIEAFTELKTIDFNLDA